jgi:formyltetrahydrofolate deformylase
MSSSSVTTSAASTAILLITCPDQKGLVATIGDFLYKHNANIIHADQHQDKESNLFLMRVEWSLTEFDLDVAAFDAQFAPIAARFQMAWQVVYAAKPLRMAIFVSQYDHCLADLLYRHHNHEFNCEIPLIISNHQIGQRLADFYNIPFFYLPVTGTTKPAVEQAQLALLRDHQIDLLILARYMQILSGDLVAHYPQRIINVHHSFLPAFSGARPYQRAFERGVKLIGATSHYVTAELDEGPIIEQDVTRVSHRDQVEDLVAKGRDLEKMVLSRAVRWHTDHRILVYNKKTVVFD